MTHETVAAAKPKADVKPDFLKIALLLARRGFRVTLIHPETKAGIFRNLHATTSPAKIQKWAERYPSHCVGVASQRGIGNLCFLDIDAEGLLERLEQESGHLIPETYTVLTRPESKPWKRHYYFRQTEYSFAKFGGWNAKNKSIHDIAVTDSRGLHPETYALKGIGGKGLVVGAGSVRENGEIYTAVDPDAPVLPIPDWLVDWVSDDFAKFRQTADAELKTKADAKAKLREKYTSEQRDRLREQNKEDGFQIYEGDLYPFARSRAGSFARKGFSREKIEQLVIWQVEHFVTNGKAFVQTELGRESIHKIAFANSLEIGDGRDFYEDQKHARRERVRAQQNTESKEGFTISTPSQQPSQHRKLVELICSFPDRILTDAAYDRIEASIPEFNRRLKPEQNAASRARKDAGFRVEGRIWIKEGI